MADNEIPESMRIDPFMAAICSRGVFPEYPHLIDLDIRTLCGVLEPSCRDLSLPILARFNHSRTWIDYAHNYAVGMVDKGWYPDPGGQPRLFRYWDGQVWTNQTTTNPQRSPTTGPQEAATFGNSRKPARLWIGFGAAIVALALIVWGIALALPNLVSPDNPWWPSGNSTADFCPTISGSASDTPSPQVPGQVSAGGLSYPTLGKPWQAPHPEDRVPYGTMALVQEAMDQTDYDGQGHGWVSSVLVSGLVSGDGFADSQNAAENVMRCVPGLFYSNNIIDRKDLSAGSRTVDGHSGWLIDSHFSFNIPGLNAKGERVLILAVQVEGDRFGLFYASIPDTRPEHLPDAMQAMDRLKVG
jgi:hypothetical protein